MVAMSVFMPVESAITFNETITSPINSLAKQTYLPECSGRIPLLLRVATLASLTLHNFGKAYEKGIFTFVRFSALLIKSLSLSTLCKGAELQMVVLTAIKTADYAFHTVFAPVFFSIGVINPKKLISLHSHLESPDLFKDADRCRQELEGDIKQFEEKKYHLNRKTLNNNDLLHRLTVTLHEIETRKCRYLRKKGHLLSKDTSLPQSRAVGRLFDQLTRLEQSLVHRKKIEESCLEYCRLAEKAENYVSENQIDLNLMTLTALQDKLQEAVEFEKDHKKTIRLNHHNPETFLEKIFQGQLHVERGMGILTKKERIKNGFETYKKQVRAIQEELGSTLEESESIDGLKIGRFFDYFEILKEIGAYYSQHEEYLDSIPDFHLERTQTTRLKSLFWEILEQKRRGYEIKIREFYRKYASQTSIPLESADRKFYQRFFQEGNFFLTRAKPHFKDLANQSSKFKKYLELFNCPIPWLNSDEPLPEKDLSFLPVIESFSKF